MVPLVSRRLASFLRHQGINTLIKRLKSCSIALNRYLSGDPVRDNWLLPVPIALRNGLPEIIPVAHRAAIRRGDIATIRIWTSLFNSYQGLRGIHPLPSYETIETPMPEIDLTEFRRFVPIFWEWMTYLGETKKVSLDRSFRNWTPYMSLSSGPNCRVSFLGYALDALAWRRAVKYDGQVDWLSKWLKAVGDDFTLNMIQLIQDYAEQEFDNPGFKGPIHQGWWSGPVPQSIPREDLWGRRELPDGTGYPTPILSKLAKKEEAAGKVRIFAIVDYWTQYCLKPLHEWMFSLLKLLPSDATFDQEEALRSIVDLGIKSHWDYDLKSATDLIPRGLYDALFRPMLGDELTDAWLGLLADRPFRVVQEPKLSYRDWLRTKQITYKEMKQASKYRRFSLHLQYKRYVEKITTHNKKMIRYGTGQPMGALSSWASLALVHHALVGYSAWKQFMFPFNTYRILGDDNEIAHHRKVAEAYLSTLKEFSIKTGGLKDYKSVSGFMNFANQSYKGSWNISPISLKEEISCTTAQSRLAFAIRICDRWRNVNPTRGYLKKLLMTVCSPKQYTKAVLPFFAGSSPTSKESLLVRMLLTILCMSPLVTKMVFNTYPWIVFPQIGLADTEMDLKSVIKRFNEGKSEAPRADVHMQVCAWIDALSRRSVAVLRDVYKNRLLDIEKAFDSIAQKPDPIDRMFFTWLLCKTNPDQVKKAQKLGHPNISRCVAHYISVLRQYNRSFFDSHPEGYGSGNSPINSLFLRPGIPGIVRSLTPRDKYHSTYGLLIKGIDHKVKSAPSLSDKAVQFESMFNELSSFAPYPFATLQGKDPFSLSTYKTIGVKDEEKMSFGSVDYFAQANVKIRDQIRRDPHFRTLQFLYKTSMVPTKVVQSETMATPLAQVLGSIESFDPNIWTGESPPTNEGKSP